MRWALLMLVVLCVIAIIHDVRRLVNR